MRLLILILFSSVFGSTAPAATQEDKIKNVSIATTSTLEILFNSNKKQHNVVIIDEHGNEVKAFKCEINKGLSAVFKRSLRFKGKYLYS
jgi:hypothetical protein